ncbi:HNH endonuclease [Nonomuraea solani]|uniref:HNH endonuclease n=1 Tax=Nonomuraea solani TaxID=1144553 RepID=UPI0038991D6E
MRKREPAQVHHVHKLTDLGKPGPPRPDWMNIMAKRRRKTLVVCGLCHAHIHRYPPASLTE